MDYVSIGKRIKRMRKARDLSQEKLAEFADISVVHMSHIETGNTKLSLPVFVDIANALEVQADDLLNDNGGRITADNEINDILCTCSSKQVKIILDLVKAAKMSLDKYM